MGALPLLTTSWDGEYFLPRIVGHIYLKQQVLVGIRPAMGKRPPVRLQLNDVYLQHVRIGIVVGDEVVKCDTVVVNVSKNFA